MPTTHMSALMRVRYALFHSIDGLVGAYSSEAAFRQELLLAIVLVAIALFLPADGPGKALMIGSVLLVLIVELINTAIEAALDRVSSELHPLAKLAKDAGSAAVLLSLINVPTVWLLVLLG